MLTNYIRQLEKQQPLTTQQANQLLQTMLSTEVNDEQIAACMSLLNLQRTNVAMLTGLIEAMQTNMQQLKLDLPVLDIVGTGGDGANTVNISTGSALLLASCGVKVAKHGNRAVSSACGSADVLATLGIDIEQPAALVKQSIEKHNFGFCFAPLFHPALLKLRKVRKALGVPTVFNLLGPLLNPARAEFLLVGVYSDDLVELFANVLNELGITKAMVFHSEGLDELTCAAPAKACLVADGEVKALSLDAAEYGLPRCQLSDLTGGDADYNARLLMQVFQGEENGIADTLVFNAAVGLYLYGVVTSINEGVDLAKKQLTNGAVLALLEKLRKSFSNLHLSS